MKGRDFVKTEKFNYFACNCQAFTSLYRIFKETL